MNDDAKQRVQRQFGDSADAYATSDIHARGESLSRLVDWINVQPSWQLLDVATGAGHTVLAFAPHLAAATAVDITAAMLDKTAELAAQRNLFNVNPVLADAEQLPFADHSFDLVTCRLAMHHFPKPDIALSEMARVLKPGGQLGFTDNVTVEDPLAAAFYNEYERLRDPSHQQVVSWRKLSKRFGEAGLSISRHELLHKEFEFHHWADRQHVEEDDKERLLQMMHNLPDPLTSFFRPRWADQTLYFHLWEVVLVAQKQPAAI